MATPPRGATWLLTPQVPCWFIRDLDSSIRNTGGTTHFNVLDLPIWSPDDIFIYNWKITKDSYESGHFSIVQASPEDINMFFGYKGTHCIFSEGNSNIKDSEKIEDVVYFTNSTDRHTKFHYRCQFYFFAAPQRIRILGFVHCAGVPQITFY